MSRIITISVTPIYHTDNGRAVSMYTTSYTIDVPSRLNKRAMAHNGTLLRSLRYFARFEGFSAHLLGKLCFSVTIKEISNGQLYSTCITFPK